MRSKTNAYDIAKIVKVSPSTVSRALNHPEQVNPDTLHKIRLAIESVDNFKVSEKPLKERIIIVNIPNFSNVFYNEVIEGIQSAAKLHDAHILIDQTILNLENNEKFLNLIQAVSAFGVILLQQVPAEVLAKIKQLTKLVQCSEYNKSVNDISYVAIDDQKAATIATDRLVQIGKTKFCFMTGDTGFKYASDREAGFRESLKKNNRLINEEWIVGLAENSFNLAYASAVRLLSLPDHPDAFFASSDTIAAAIIRAAHQLKLDIPRDLAVVGFDDSIISQMTVPSITTIAQPKSQEGYTALEILFSSGMETPEIILNTELILRESTEQR